MRELRPLLLCLMLTACMPLALPGQPANPVPVLPPQVDLQATANVMASTQAAQTISALPTPAERATDTVTPSPTETAVLLLLPTDLPGLAGTMTATLLTAPPPPFATATETLMPFSIDQLPAGTTYGSFLLVNQSRTGVSVSLHCTTRQGLRTVIEVERLAGRQTVEAPLGDYVVVAYIGGHQVITSFSYRASQRVTISFEKDKIVVH